MSLKKSEKNALVVPFVQKVENQQHGDVFHPYQTGSDQM